MAAGEAGRLHAVMAALARPVRLARGKEVGAGWAVDESLLQQDEERALVDAYRQAAAQARRWGARAGWAAERLPRDWPARGSHGKAEWTRAQAKYGARLERPQARHE